MTSPEIYFKVSGKYRLWMEALSDIEESELCFLQTECTFIAAALEREISVRANSKPSVVQSQESQDHEFREAGSHESELDRCFTVIRSTAHEINCRGFEDIAHCQTSRQDKFFQARIISLKSFLCGIQQTASIKKETWRNDAYDTMLRLIAKYVKVAASLLVLYSIRMNQFRLLKLGEVAGIVRFVMQNPGIMTCEVFDSHARTLLGEIYATVLNLRILISFRRPNYSKNTRPTHCNFTSLQLAMYAK